MIDHVANMRALLNHHDPFVVARGREMVKASRDPAVRALLNSSHAAAPRGQGGPSRADRAAKSASTKLGANNLVVSVGGARRTRPGNNSQKDTSAVSTNLDRIAANFGGQPRSAPPSTFDRIAASLGQPRMTRAEERQAAIAATSEAIFATDAGPDKAVALTRKLGLIR